MRMPVTQIRKEATRLPIVSCDFFLLLLNVRLKPASGMDGTRTRSEGGNDDDFAEWLNPVAQ